MAVEDISTSAYEQVTREKVEDLQKDFDDYKKQMNSSLEKINDRLLAIENNLNSRPTWAVAIVISALSTICCGLAVYLFTKGG